MGKRIVTGLVILSLAVLPACAAIDNAIAKLTTKFDQIKNELKGEARLAMDRLEIAMQDAVKTFIEKGKAAADEKIKDVVTLLVALSGQLKGNLQNVIGGAIAKAIGGDQGLLSQIKTMAAENPELLKSLSDQFVGAIVDSTQRRLSEGGMGGSLVSEITSGISTSIRESIRETATQIIGSVNQSGGASSFNLNAGNVSNVGTGSETSSATSPGESVRINRADPTGGNSLDDDFFAPRVTMDDSAPRPAGRGYTISRDNPEVLIFRRQPAP
jgi:hypothetical protein